MQPGDEIRSFTNSDRHRNVRMGRRRYALIRNGQVIEVMLTAMN